MTFWPNHLRISCRHYYALHVNNSTCLLRTRIFSYITAVKLLHFNLRLIKLYNFIFNPEFPCCRYIFYSFFFSPFSIPSSITHCILFGDLFIPLYSRFSFSFYDLDILEDPAPFILRLAGYFLMTKFTLNIWGRNWRSLSFYHVLGNTWYPFDPPLFILNLITW